MKFTSSPSPTHHLRAGAKLLSEDHEVAEPPAGSLPGGAIPGCTELLLADPVSFFLLLRVLHALDGSWHDRREIRFSQREAE